MIEVYVKKINYIIIYRNNLDHNLHLYQIIDGGEKEDKGHKGHFKKD